MELFALFFLLFSVGVKGTDHADQRCSVPGGQNFGKTIFSLWFSDGGGIFCLFRGVFFLLLPVQLLYTEKLQDDADEGV